MGSPSRRVHPCYSVDCLLNVLEPRLYCPEHWSLIHEELQRKLAEAVLAAEPKVVESLVDEANALIAAAERRRSGRHEAPG